MDVLILCILTRVRALSGYIGILAIHALTTTGHHLCKQADTLPPVLLSNNKQEIQCNEESCLSAMIMFSHGVFLNKLKEQDCNWIQSCFSFIILAKTKATSVLIMDQLKRVLRWPFLAN